MFSSQGITVHDSTQFDSNGNLHNPIVAGLNWGMKESMDPTGFSGFQQHHPAVYIHQQGVPDLQTALNPQPAQWNRTVPDCVPWFQEHNPFPLNFAAAASAELDKDKMSNGSAFLRHKRKGEELDLAEVPPPNKQYISEETMSSRLKQLHISNSVFNNAVDALPVASGSEHTQPTFDKPETRLLDDNSDLGIDGKPNVKNSCLILAPEIARPIEQNPILPLSVLNEIRKPPMEIVLWKPPGGLVDHLIRTALAKDDDKTESSNGKSPSTSGSKRSDQPGSTHLSQFPSFSNINGTTTQSSGFFNFRTFTMPAMTPSEIERLEEEMNLS